MEAAFIGQQLAQHDGERGSEPVRDRPQNSTKSYYGENRRIWKFFMLKIPIISFMRLV